MRTNFRIIVRKFLRNNVGATAIEYGLIAALIGIALIAGATKMGKMTEAQITCTGFAMESAGEVDNVAGSYQNCVRIRSGGGKSG